MNKVSIQCPNCNSNTEITHEELKEYMDEDLESYFDFFYLDSYPTGKVFHNFKEYLFTSTCEQCGFPINILLNALSFSLTFFEKMDDKCIEIEDFIISSISSNDENNLKIDAFKKMQRLQSFQKVIGYIIADTYFKFLAPIANIDDGKIKSYRYRLIVNNRNNYYQLICPYCLDHVSFKLLRDGAMNKMKFICSSCSRGGGFTYHSSEPIFNDIIAKMEQTDTYLLLNETAN